MRRRALQLRCDLQMLMVFFCLALCALQPQQAQTQARDINLQVVYAINAGGFEHIDKNGIVYETDPLHNKIGTASDYGKHLLIIGRVQEQDEVLYRTERYHTATFGYDIPILGDGEYALVLKFCEVYFNAPNKKVFDVVLNKKHTIVSELDIFHQVGRGTAHEEYAFFTIKGNRLYYKDEVSEVRRNLIRLDFIKGPLDNPKINAFVLFKGDVDEIPRLSPISDDILPMDADMAVFHDRVSADNSPSKAHLPGARDMKSAVPNPTLPPAEQAVQYDDTDEEDVETTNSKTVKFSGPRQPSPYSMDDSSVMLPVFIAIGTFIPLLFCICKL